MRRAAIGATALLALLTGTAAAAPTFEATKSAPRGTLIKGVKASASSTLCEGAGAKRVCHAAENLLDDDRATAWCEGANGKGVGEWITLSLPAPVELRALSIVPYYAKDFRRAIGNLRPSRILVEHDTGKFELTLEDFPALVERQSGERDERIRAEGAYSVNFGEEDAPPPPLTGFVRLTIRAAHPGGRAQDLCISSLRVFAK